jgi:phenylalanyl-tRNA synthetase beta chain
MNISYRWLQELIDGLDSAPRELADRLALLGAPVDEVTELGGPLREIRIARVAAAQRHPNADRLNLCTVDAGTGEMLQVVCGAPNVRAGALYPFAPVGSTLPGGVAIRAAKIRGVESQGMLCSARELGLGREHDGILELRGEFEPGHSFVEATRLDDTRLAVDVTPNRPDLLSHLGVARELAAAVGARINLPALPGAGEMPPLRLHATGQPGATAAGVTVTIEAPDLCSRYLGLVIRGVTVGPSPEWLAMRLRALGLRPISNVVDATNYVLHEIGQPLHAFDLSRLGPTVAVRAARAGERITTLDGIDRELAAGTTVIADRTRPVAVAGVMGGADTEVHGDTRDILLECALFDPQAVRAARRALGLSTDASYRFERGIDPDMMQTALERAAQLITAVAGGTIDGDVADAGAAPAPPHPVALRLRRVEQLLGVPFTAGQVAGYLAPLGFGVEAADDAVHVSIPGHRRYDVAREEDLIEEIARRHGYDSFPDELRPFRPSVVPDHPLFALEDRLRTLLAARGLLEAHTAAFVPEPDGDVALLLPLAATESRLRASLLPGLLRRVEYNFARGARSIRLFEIGTCFTAGDDALPTEATRLGLVITGQRAPQHWTQPESAFDVWDLKALAEDVAAALGLTVSPAAVGAAPALDDTLSFALRGAHNETVRGVAGMVRPDRVDSPAWAEPVWALEVELDSAAARSEPPRFQALPQHPAVERDVALLVPDAVPSATIADAIRGAGGALLEWTGPFDVYSGSSVPSGTRSIAFRLRFRAVDRTLTDGEVDDVMRRILHRLSNDLGVEQRA